MKYYFVIFLCFFNFHFYGQTLKIKITDSTNNTPIVFVNVVIKNSTKGTITNSEGVFELFVSESLKNEILIISCIGYEKKELEIADLIKNNTTAITLNKITIELDEVYISSNKLSADEIVQKAFDRFDSNFPNNPFYSKGFLRHLEKTQKAYMWLIESAVEVYDPGFNKDSELIKLNIPEIRKTLDFRKLDTTSILISYIKQTKGISFNKAKEEVLKRKKKYRLELDKAINLHDNRHSNPKKIFQSYINIIRNFKNKNAVFEKGPNERHHFEIDSIIPYENDFVYKIKITPKVSSKRFEIPWGDSLLPVGWIFIKSSDFKITEIDYSLIYKSNKKIDRNLHSRIFGSNLRFSFKINFKEINNKMYPQYMMLIKPKINSSPETIFELSKNTNQDEIEKFYFIKQEILFTDIETDSNEIERMLNDKSWNDDLFSERSYNGEFWKNNSIFLEDVNEEKMRLDLEKKVSLKKQFEQQ